MQEVGPALEKLLLWGGELSGGLLFLPYGLRHPRASLGLSSMLKDHLYAKFGGVRRKGGGGRCKGLSPPPTEINNVERFVSAWLACAAASI